ncbi:MAG: HAD-superfamily hydrolase, subfamily variant 1 [Candidatus Taylorbacteria bacterium]|nr:HAD-superfamily hydrolase, subfamily variant 1 [Candidatus Taylorbacteria bacterium]
MSKKVIIFDMDGVLFDTIPYAREVFTKRHPGVTSEMYNEMHSGNYHDEAAKYAHLKIIETEEEKENHRMSYVEKKGKTAMFVGMKDLLKNLHHEGYLLAINTNAFDKTCLPLLEYSQIKQYFDFIVTADVTKDKVEKFKLIEEKYDREKKGMLFVTDALGDIRDADVAQVPTVAVTWGVQDRSFFMRDPHPNLVGIVDTVDELAEFIKKY